MAHTGPVEHFLPGGGAVLAAVASAYLMAVYYGGLVLQPSAANRALSLLGLPGERDDVAGALKEVKDQAGLQLREPLWRFPPRCGSFPPS